MLVPPKVSNIVFQQRKFFATGKTKDISFRIQHLKLLKRALLENEAAIFKALQIDLNKSVFEAALSEIGVCLEEINYALKNI
ncbi:MAG TPA: aldehyde dehydrogenase family protein, partial [Phormidium sp.]